VIAYEVSTFDALTGNYSYLENDASCFSGASKNASTAFRCYSITPVGGKATLVKYVGIASTDAFEEPLPTAIKASQGALATGYDKIMKEHVKGWDELFGQSDIIIPGESDELQELQLATRASIFHILANTLSSSMGEALASNSIAPAGLTSDSYAGSIFWDAETWMYPSLLVLFPKYAETINNFRFRQLPQAKMNAQQNNRSGAIYPWIAARYGNCTGIGPCIGRWPSSARGDNLNRKQITRRIL
jgi:trehalose/maltose hydrolase-like predicted phosphorylase